MDSLEARLVAMSNLVIQMAVEYDEINEELSYWRRMALLCAALNLVWIGVVSFMVFS